MAKYVAYSKVHFKNKPTGRFIVTTMSNTKKGATLNANRLNNEYNKLQRKKEIAGRDYAIKLIAVKKQNI